MISVKAIVSHILSSYLEAKKKNNANINTCL